MVPRFPTVHALVYAVADTCAVADVPLASANPYDVGRHLKDRDITDRGHGLVVEYRLPCKAPIDRFPHAAGSRTDVDDVGISLHHSDR